MSRQTGYHVEYLEGNKWWHGNFREDESMAKKIAKHITNKYGLRTRVVHRAWKNSDTSDETYNNLVRIGIM